MTGITGKLVTFIKAESGTLSGLPRNICPTQGTHSNRLQRIA